MSTTEQHPTEQHPTEQHSAGQPQADPSARSSAAGTAGTTTTVGSTASAGGATSAGTSEASAGTVSKGPAPLLPESKSREYRDRWTELKGQFVDDPKDAVHGIDGLVGELLDELQTVFRTQRGELERGLHDEQRSTEELRVAFGRYREFFDRLLSM